MTPLVSIVITNYNYARFLSCAIDSALAQTHPRVEVIVVDDGSRDRSAEVIAGYGDRVVPVLKRNGGQASAFNAGAEVARGDAVCFLDADDALLPNAIADAVACFHRRDLTKVQWQMHEIDSAGRLTGKLVPGDPLPDGDLRQEAIEGGPPGGVSVPTSGNAWSRAYLDEVLPVPEDEFRICADAYLFTLAAAVGPVGAAPRPLGLYRTHADNNYGATGRKPLLARSSLQLEWYRRRCDILERFLARSGVAVSRDDWDRRNGYRTWLTQVHACFAQIDRALPANTRFVFVDDDQLGTGPVTDMLNAVPFAHGMGPPADGSEAVRELERHRRDGATHIVVAWPAYHWLDTYPELVSHLAARELPTGAGVRVFEL